MIPNSVHEFLSINGYGAVLKVNAVGGGCISNGQIISTKSGKSFFLKTNRDVPDDMFSTEAEGLRVLQVEGGPVVPTVLTHGHDYILMEDLKPGHLGERYWENFGRQLATLHQYTETRFGFENNNYIGSAKQYNTWTWDGYTFFADKRLLHQARLARKNGYLNADDLERAERIASRLQTLIPVQPASLSHGDLWRGNVISDECGAPAIIDPAVYYGWAEADLAMTALFGAFPPEFYGAYNEARPLVPDFYSRFPIYNLYHLLNHLNLFGRGYLSQAQDVLRRFA